MNRFKLTTLAVALSGLACASQSPESGDTHAHNPEPTKQSVQAVTAELAADEAQKRPSVALAQRLHDRDISEIVVGPRGRAALTLDTAGGVRLWSDLRAESVAPPVALPVEEPTWMSIAKSAQGFTVAFIDTAGATHVGRVTIDDGGGRWTSLFERPGTDPQFEIHVLDGGERIVSLGVDHRIHVWDHHGTTVAMLDEPGFVPWQLRISQPEGEAPNILAVIAGPVRVQPITFKDDTLAITGEARNVALDRGPNRSDLTMSPDGTTVAALRRPKARGKRFELEIIDLKTDARKIIAAESDVKKRPRVHAIDANRVLMESGSGDGFYVNFDAAVPWPPADGEPDREALEVTPLQTFALPSSAATRMHSSVVDGVRFVPDGRSLVVDPLGEGETVSIVRKGFSATALALDVDGDQVAWGTSEAILLESIGQPGAMHKLAPTESEAELLAFVGGGKLLAMDTQGRASLRGITDGETLSTAKLSIGWGIAESGWRPDDEGGHVVLSSTRPKEDLHILPVAGGAFGTARDVARREQSQWPEAGKPRGMESRTWISEIGLAWDELRLRPAEVRLTPPDPTGRLIAIVQRTAENSLFDESQDRWVTTSDFVLTMFDREAGKRLWTHRVSSLRGMAWSANGQRFGLVESKGGFVFDAPTGAVVHARHDLGLEIRGAS